MNSLRYSLKCPNAKQLHCLKIKNWEVQSSLHHAGQSANSQQINNFQIPRWKEFCWFCPQEMQRQPILLPVLYISHLTSKLAWKSLISKYMGLYLGLALANQWLMLFPVLHTGPNSRWSHSLSFWTLLYSFNAAFEAFSNICPKSIWRYQFECGSVTMKVQHHKHSAIKRAWDFHDSRHK